MKTIGQYLYIARTKKGMSIEALSRETKIKKEFIKAIEGSEWNLLPGSAVTAGFVKNLADTLDLDRTQAVALFRRDYPKVQAPASPKPDLPVRSVSINPVIGFIVTSLLLAFVVITYLVIQFINFNKAPSLHVDSPTESQVITGDQLTVKGKTDAGATVRVNNQPAFVDDEGNFETQVPLSDKTDKIQVEAQSRSGKSTTTTRSIKKEN
jgi:cytoskeletal protein RodZ